MLLLSPGILGFRNRLSRTHGAGLKKPLFMGGLGLVFGVILFVLSSRVLVYFQSVEMIGDILAKELLSMVFLTFFSLLIFSNIIHGTFQPVPLQRSSVLPLGAGFR